MNPNRIDYLKSKEIEAADEGYMSSELTDFYTAIFEFQKKLYQDIKSTSPGLQISTGEEGFPILKTENLHEATQLESTLKKAAGDLAEIITSHHPDMDFTELKKNLSESGSSVISFLKTLISQDFQTLNKTSEDLKLIYEGFIFLIINSAKPVLAAIRDNSGIECPGEDWLEPYCPFCGYLPDFGIISEKNDNRLSLHCGLCEMKWRFTRLTCTNCGNNDREKLTYYQSEIDEIHSIYCCHECKAYIKIFRIPKNRELTSIDLVVENIISNYLDATAMDMGYSRP